MLVPKHFQTWTSTKSIIHNNNLNRPLYFHYKEGGIYYVYLGENVGYEEDGKGILRVRPFLILKGYNQNLFFGVPLTTKNKGTKYHYQLESVDLDVQSVALLNQGRTLDIARIKDRVPVAMVSLSEVMKIRGMLF